MKILLSIVTTGKNKDFIKKIRQLEQLKIKEIALFLTAIDYKERQGLYRLLEKSSIEKVPFVHLRNDMEPPEIEYLSQRWGAELFNIHGRNSLYPFDNDLGRFNKQIYLESQFHLLDKADLQKYAGVCLDVSHLHDFKKVLPEVYKNYIEVLNEYPCGCGHISAMNFLPRYWSKGKLWHYSWHHFRWLWQFNYIKQYKRYLPTLMALELENDIPEQLKAKQYIEKILA